MQVSLSNEAQGARPTSRPDRETLRERERKSRQKRVAKLERQRETLRQFERVVAMLPSLLDPNDTSSELVLQPDAVQVHDHLKRLIMVARQQRQLERENSQLKLLLYEKIMASAAVQSLLATISSDWDASLRHWRMITRQHFKPKTMEDCLEEVEAAQKELNAFLWSLDTQLLSGSFFGWRIRRRIVESGYAVQFSYEKKVIGSSMIDLVNIWWNCYRDPTMYNDIIAGKQRRGWVEVLQELTPDMMIVRVVDSYPSIPLTGHTVYLGCRVKTDSGFLIFWRTLFEPEIQKRTNQLSDMWASNFVWLSFDALNGDGTDYKAHIGGKLGGPDADYAAKWLMETLAVILRTEWAATKRGLLES